MSKSRKVKNTPLVIFNVAFSGLFQQGKSLTVNCLMEDYISEIGIGVSTTRRVLLIQFHNTVFISDTPGFNSTGKNEATDTKEAEIALNTASLVLFIVPNQSLDQTTMELIRDVAMVKPVALLMNCQERGNVPSLQDPMNQTNMKTARSIESQLQGIDSILKIDGKSIVFNYNPAWYFWYAIAMNNQKVRDIVENNALRYITHTISNYRGYLRDNDLPEMSAEDYINASRINILKNFLKNNVIIPVPTLTCKQDENTVHLSWTINNKNQEYCYELEYRKKEDGSWKIIETSDMEKTISGLDESSTYEFHVRSKDRTTNQFSSFSDKKSINIPSHKPRVIVINSRGKGGMFEDFDD